MHECVCAEILPFVFITIAESSDNLLRGIEMEHVSFSRCWFNTCYIVGGHVYLFNIYAFIKHADLHSRLAEHYTLTHSKHLSPRQVARIWTTPK